MKVELRSAHGDITITLRPDSDDEGSADQALLDLLGQADERGSRPRVSWLPERYAQVGRYLKLKNPDGAWENGWQVTATHARRRFDEIEAKERDYRHQREASDV